MVYAFAPEWIMYLIFVKFFKSPLATSPFLLVCSDVSNAADAYDCKYKK